VVDHTNFDTINHFHLQVFGMKKLLLFEHSAAMRPYPNIHRSYSFSQVLLEEGREDLDAFPELKEYRPIEVRVK